MRFWLVLAMISFSWAVQAAMLPAFPVQPKVPAGDLCVQESHISGGDAIPWPWGNEMQFPWTRIQGVWAPLTGDCESYFVFKVSKLTTSGERFIQIIQYDPLTCEKIAVGAGFENNKVIYASMANKGQSFDLTIRAFDNSIIDQESQDSTIISRPPLPSVKAVVVLTMYPKAKWEKRVSYQMEKLNSIPDLTCGP